VIRTGIALAGVSFGEGSFRGAYNIALEPARPSSCAIHVAQARGSARALGRTTRMSRTAVNPHGHPALTALFREELPTSRTMAKGMECPSNMTLKDPGGPTTCTSGIWYLLRQQFSELSTCILDASSGRTS